MEQRFAKISKRKAGGTAGENSVKYSVNIPSAWANKLCSDDNKLELSFDGEQIIIKKCVDVSGLVFLKQARDAGHVVKTYRYRDGKTLCSTLYLDFTAKQLCVDNADVSLLDTAFGVNTTPTWQDLITFFTSRCIPETRIGINYYLKSIGLSQYDPFAIIDITEGRMAEDNKWLEKI